MIGFLAGQILENQEGKILITMGFPSGGTIGYQLTTPVSSAYARFLPGEMASFYVYTHVREDALDLYGFSSREEKELYITLLTVNGIGPKGAIGILSKVEIPTLIQAILQDDKELLTQIPGIGKKTAERVVLELADPIKKKMDQGLLPRNWSEFSGAPGKNPSRSESRAVFSSQILMDAKSALAGLGYREQEIISALKRLQDETPELPKRAEEVIKLALQQLN